MRRYFHESADRFEQQEKVPTIIFFHGNSGNIGNRLPGFWEFYNLVGVNSLAVSYRGYGDSEGVPSEEGFYLDAKAASKYAVSRMDVVDGNKIFAFGHSICGAVTIDLASKVRLTGIILENTFKDLNSVALRIYPIFKYFGFLMKAVQRLRFDSISKIPNVKFPILFVVGSEDEIVPPVHSIQLFKKAGGRGSLNRVYTVSGGAHNDTWLKGGMEFYLMLMQFIYNVIDFTEPDVVTSSEFFEKQSQKEVAVPCHGKLLGSKESTPRINIRKKNKLE